jgi:hypothetical protein
MKVALVLFGQPRYVQTGEVFESHRKWILDKYDTDVYAHMWFSSDGKYSVATHSHTNGYCPPNSEEIIRGNYNPKRILVEESKTFKLREDVKTLITQKFQNTQHWEHSSKNMSTFLSQLYSIESAIRLIPEPEKYDLIALCRYDMVIEHFPDLSTLDSSKFYCMNHHPRFPDIFFIFGPSFLKSQFTSSCIEDEIMANQQLLNDSNIFWEPIAEAFKFFHYYVNYDVRNIVPIYIKEHRVIEK